MSTDETASPERVLFISPRFFGYERDIYEALERRGLIVDFFDERPSNSSLAKAVFRLGSRITTSLVTSYYRRILDNTKRHNYGQVLVVKGEVVPRWFVVELRQANPDARIVYYSFDPIAPGSNSADLLDLFDDAFSFDPVDVARYPVLRYKSLFYSPAFHPFGDGRPPSFELAFIGTLHSDRHRFVTSLFSAFERTFAYFYVPARWYFAVMKYATRKFAATSWSEVSFAKLDKQDVADIFRSSRAVLDLQRDGQTGLTMRTFEVLASGAILVTGNSAIRDSEFFDPSRMLVIDDYTSASASPGLLNALRQLEPVSGPPAGFERFSVDSWVEELVA